MPNTDQSDSATAALNRRTAYDTHTHGWACARVCVRHGEKGKTARKVKKTYISPAERVEEKSNLIFAFAYCTMSVPQSGSDSDSDIGTHTQAARHERRKSKPKYVMMSDECHYYYSWHYCHTTTSTMQHFISVWWNFWGLYAVCCGEHGTTHKLIYRFGCTADKWERTTWMAARGRGRERMRGGGGGERKKKREGERKKEW